MQQFFALVRKEFSHILRDRRSLFVLFGMPIVQILIFGFALSNEVKDSKIAVLDPSKDADTEGVIQAIEASRYFDVDRNLLNFNEIEAAFRSGKIKLALVFPQNFTTDFRRNGKAQIQLIADASDPNTATTVVNYATAIIADYNSRAVGNPTLPLSISVETRMLYNPQLKDAYNFVPGLMAMILMLISSMMTAVAIVREKELGTMEVLLVSPMKPLLMVFSKMIPYLMLSIINFLTISALSFFVLKVPFRGSFELLASISTLYIACSLALGLLISSFAETQQVALMASLIGLMMPTILFSGFMFPIENLPKPMQLISNIIPAKWFFIIAKNIMIKGVSLHSIWREVSILGGMTLFFIMVSVIKFKVRLG
jgi:ABC-2 type transport system permease protein